MSPDYHQRDSWSYSYTMSPKAPPKKEKKDKERENGEGGKDRDTVKLEGRVEKEGRSRSLEQGEVVVNGDGVMKEE